MSLAWIKMRVDLQSHPKIVRILSATGTDKFRVIGGLHAVWSVFDAHSEDGKLKGYTPELLDHIIGWEGFSRAMESVGWLIYDGLETLEMPDFTEHNGQSAKRRAEDQKRKKLARKASAKCPQECGQNEDEVQTREEKRREENKTQPSPPAADVRFEKFWQAYPKKVGKGAAEKAWTKARINGEFDSVIASLEAQKTSEQWRKDGGQFVPNPATWLNEKRWLDEVQTAAQRRGFVC